MTATPPRLVVLKGASALDPEQAASLQSAFELVEVENLEAARQMLNGPGGALLLCSSELLGGLDPQSVTSMASTVMNHIGEGAGVVDAAGRIAWCNRQLGQSSEETQARFVELALLALEDFNRPDESGQSPSGRRSRRYAFSAGENHFELVVSPAAPDASDGERITAVIGVLWDVTLSRRAQHQIDALDAAGSELMKIEAGAIRDLHMADRLKLLEEKIVHYVHDLLHFDNFEIRLLDRETSQLELVFAVGISPLKIGEVIYAKPEGNGISGYVAATGQSYVCPDVQHDPLYREGLDNAASSLTTPLRLYDQVIGVFNIESNTANAFDENDRQFAEIFGRYIAMAMNILDLLVVERYTTNEQIAENVLGELSEPLAQIEHEAAALRERSDANEPVRTGLDRILDAAAKVRRGVEACAAGPKTILGAEMARHRLEPDPLMVGKRVLIADNEPAIRETAGEILRQKGCQVTICHCGAETIEQLRGTEDGPAIFDVVVSDIKMPDNNGYEVFRIARQISKDTQVILMTGFGYDPHHSIVRASQEGLSSFLFKPFKASQLVEAVSKALTQS